MFEKLLTTTLWKTAHLDLKRMVIAVSKSLIDNAFMCTLISEGSIKRSDFECMLTFLIDPTRYCGGSFDILDFFENDELIAIRNEFLKTKEVYKHKPIFGGGSIVFDHLLFSSRNLETLHIKLSLKLKSRGIVIEKQEKGKS